jgi:YHS domain-containing protein
MNPQQYKNINLPIAGLIVICLFLTIGCQKKTKPAAPPATEANAATATTAVEQTICPVMGLPIDKNVFTIYQGKKVYFCCTNCKAEFEKNPGKYLSKLPQFAK